MKIYIVKFQKDKGKIIKQNCFAILYSQELKKLKRKQFNYIKILRKRKAH